MRKNKLTRNGYGDSVTDHRFSSYGFSYNFPLLPNIPTNPSAVKKFRSFTFRDIESFKRIDTNNLTKDDYLSSFDFADTMNETVSFKDMTEKLVDSHSAYDIEGIPCEFINSFGNFLGLKYFLNGVKNKKDVHTYIDKIINIVDFNNIKSKFNQCRFINMSNMTEYEFYDPDLGYCVIRNEFSTPDIFKILCAVGYNSLNEIIKNMGQNMLTRPMASWVTGIDSYGELVIKQFSIKDIYEYQPEFYPFMNGENIKDFAERYMNSNSSILLLIGPPGTAKTNFIRQLLSATNESVLLTYSEDLKKTDKLFSYFYDSPEKFLIIEDADTYIERRQDGNSNMKQLLNITDGLTANSSKKVIFSTNLPTLNRVEPALLRPGRCFDKLQFGKLSNDNLVNAMNVIGADYFKDIVVPKDGFTIAELFSIKNNEFYENEKSITTFGFTN